MILIKTFVTDATDVGGVSKRPEEQHDETVNSFLKTHDIVEVHFNTLPPLFNNDFEQGPALVTTIVYRA